MMADNGTIEIFISKSKLSKLLIFGVAFVCGGLWIIIKQPEVNNPMFNNAVVKALASYGAVLMGVVGICLASRKLFDNKPGLIINHEGIYDNTSVFNIGLIPWTDVSQIYDNTIRVSFFSKQSFVTIALSDPDKYILQEKNLLKRKLLQANANSYGSPIHISTNTLKINQEELLEILARNFDFYNNQSIVTK